MVGIGHLLVETEWQAEKTAASRIDFDKVKAVLGRPWDNMSWKEKAALIAPVVAGAGVAGGAAYAGYRHYRNNGQPPPQ